MAHLLRDGAIEAFSKQDQLPTPSRSLIRATQDWLSHEDFGDSFMLPTEMVWNPERSNEDFLTLTRSEGLSLILARLYIKIRQKFQRANSPARVYSIDATETGGIGQGFAIVTSSILPVLPIIVLYFIDNRIARIFAILGFTAVFAGILVFGLKLSAEQVLTITTA